jgi:hypothetical protein
MNELWQMLRFISMGELREYMEMLQKIDDSVFQKFITHIKKNPPRTYKPYTGP